MQILAVFLEKRRYVTKNQTKHRACQRVLQRGYCQRTEITGRSQRDDGILTYQIHRVGMAEVGSMTRLIDADKLASDLLERWHTADKEAESLISAAMANVVTPILASQPTVDAVPVTRCRECKYSKPLHGDKRLCFLWDEDGIDVFEDGYCNYSDPTWKDSAIK